MVCRKEVPLLDPSHGSMRFSRFQTPAAAARTTGLKKEETKCRVSRKRRKRKTTVVPNFKWNPRATKPMTKSVRFRFFHYLLRSTPFTCKQICADTVCATKMRLVFCFRTFDLDTCRRNEMSIEVVQWKSCGVVSGLCVKNRTRAHPIGESATNQRDTQTDR